MRRGENVLPLATLRNVRRSKKYGPHHTWKRRTWPIGNGTQLKAMCSFATILMNRPILVNNLLEFHSQKQPKPSLFRSSDTNYKPAAVSSFSQVISLHPKNSVEHWTSHTERHFLGQLKPYSNFFTKNRVVDGHSWEIQRMSSAPLFFSNKVIIWISSRCYCRTITFVICMTDFTASSNILCNQVWSQVF